MTAASSLLLACCLLLFFQGQRGRGGAVVKRTPGVSCVGRWHRPQPQHPRVRQARSVHRPRDAESTVLHAVIARARDG